MPRSDKPLTERDVLNQVLDFPNSRLQVDLSELPNAAALADATANPTTQGLAAYQMQFEEAAGQWERQRGNPAEATLLASAARTGSVSAPNQTNYNCRGILILINVTVNPGGAQTLQTRLMSRHPLTGSLRVLLDDGAQAFGGAAGQRAMLLYPGIGAASNGIDTAVSRVLPREWILDVLHSGAGSWTYSVTSHLIL